MKLKWLVYNQGMRIFLPTWIVLSLGAVYVSLIEGQATGFFDEPLWIVMSLGVTLFISVVLTFLVEGVLKFFLKSETKDSIGQTMNTKKNYTVSVVLGILFFVVGGILGGLYVSMTGEAVMWFIAPPFAAIIGMFGGLLLGLGVDYYRHDRS